MTPSELKAARKKLGLNQTEMAKRLRTSYDGYIKWERGTRPIRGVVEVAVEEVLWHDAMVMRAITETLAQSFPGTGTR